MESQNQSSSSSEEELIAAKKLHQRLRRLSEVPNLEDMAVFMFELLANRPTPYLTTLEENFLSSMEQYYGIK